MIKRFSYSIIRKTWLGSNLFWVFLINFYNIMMQQLYRRPPCKRAISIKLCSNIIKIAILRGCLLQICVAVIQNTLEKLLFAVIKNALKKLSFVILTFLQVHKHTSSFVLVCTCAENEIQSVQNIFIRVNNEHINIIQITISIRINN